MKETLSELFWETHLRDYQQIGNEVSYAFREDEDTLYIFFQGSNGKTDWFRNFFFFPIGKKPYKGMEIKYSVHRGFLKAWKEVEDVIIDKILEKSKRKFKWKHIVVSGYSHGGALTQFATECIWYYRPDLRENGFEAYGFEAPRIYHGWKVKKELKERWNNFTLIRNNNDLVTHCPPHLFRFCDLGGNIIKIKGNRKLVKAKCPGFIKDHYPECVIDGLAHR